MEPNRIRKLIRPRLLNITPYSSARDEFSDAREGKIFLDANENPYDTGFNRYPDPHQRKIKEVLSDRKGLPANQIFLGNGSDEVLDLLFRAFCVPGVDNCMILPPTYGMYGVLAAINDVEVREVLLKTDFQPDVDAILEHADSRSKILFVCSPNNPSGNLMNKDAIEDLLKHFPGLVVIDEAYVDFSGQESWATRLEEFPNMIVTQTFSKAYGLAGIRLGSCYAHPFVIGILNAIKPPYNVNQLTQEMVLTRLEERGYIQDITHSIIAEKDKLIKALIDLEFVKIVYPSDANFLLVEMDDADKRYAQLLEQNIVVRNRSKQPLCKNCLRITVGTPEQNAKLLVELNRMPS